MAEKTRDNDTITMSRADLAGLLDQMVTEKLANMPAKTGPIESNLKLAELAQVMQASSDAQHKAEYEARLKAMEAELGLGVEGRSQKVADQMYPKQAGDRLWQVKLEDRNGQPKLTLPAPTGEDARARYQQVCGITAVVDRRSKWIIEVLA